MIERSFLVKAKQNTYATGDPGKILADGIEEFEFQEGDLRYRDRFCGGNAFIGQELVWQAGQPVWGMNYYGVVTSAAPPEVGHFLKKALQQVTEDRPYRGPRSLADGDLTYLDESQGDVDSFSGVEVILHRGKEVYRLVYHGGSLETAA